MAPGAIDNAATVVHLDQFTARVPMVVETASDFLARYAAPRRHHIACALALRSGRIVLGVNIVANIGPASICAEQVALGEALKCPYDGIELIVTTRATFDERRPTELVPPCGRCRELLCEYAAGAHIVLPGNGGAGAWTVVGIGALLPSPFRRRAALSIGESRSCPPADDLECEL